MMHAPLQTMASSPLPPDRARATVVNFTTVARAMTRRERSTQDVN